MGHMFAGYDEADLHLPPHHLHNETNDVFYDHIALESMVSH